MKKEEPTDFDIIGTINAVMENRREAKSENQAITKKWDALNSIFLKEIFDDVIKSSHPYPVSFTYVKFDRMMGYEYEMYICHKIRIPFKVERNGTFSNDPGLENFKEITGMYFIMDHRNKYSKEQIKYALKKKVANEIIDYEIRKEKENEKPKFK